MKLVMIGLLLVMGGVGGVEQSVDSATSALAGSIVGFGLILTYFGVKRIAE